MLEIWAYAFGIMYSPGPVNLLGLHGGLQGRTRQNLGYFSGVATAMFILFIIMSLLGSLVTKSLLPYISVLGCGYILHIAIKLLRANLQLDNKAQCMEQLSYRDGLVLQLLNPKGVIATLPIVTIQFPGIGITGLSSLFWIVALSVFAFGAPMVYSVLGASVGNRIQNPVYFRILNTIMALLLIYVVLGIGYQYIYLPWF